MKYRENRIEMYDPASGQCVELVEAGRHYCRGELRRVDLRPVGSYEIELSIERRVLPGEVYSEAGIYFTGLAVEIERPDPAFSWELITCNGRYGCD